MSTFPIARCVHVCFVCVLSACFVRVMFLSDGANFDALMIL